MGFSSMGRSQAQAQAQQSSRSTQGGSPSTESAQVRRTCVGHTQAPQVQCLLSVSQLGQRKHSFSSSTEKQDAQFITRGSSLNSVSRNSSATKERVKIFNLTPSLAQIKRGVLCQTSKNHHVVSVAVIVMCLMRKCMETSKVQVQINNKIWSSCFAVLLMFTFCVPISRNSSYHYLWAFFFSFNNKTQTCLSKSIKKSKFELKTQKIELPDNWAPTRNT